MKRMIATIVLTVLIMLAAVCAGFTWDEHIVASSSVSTLNIAQTTDDTTDGAWGS